jgi:hypothetical protein
MSDTEALWRVVTVRKKTITNPKYNYWNAKETGEPPYIILDETVETYSKPFKNIGAAKGHRTRQSLYNLDTLISMDIQKAHIAWETLAEDNL